MTKPLDQLLSEREKLKADEKTLSNQIVSEVEKYVVSAIYLRSKTADSAYVKKPDVTKAVQNLYDKRFTDSDINLALESLVKQKILNEHKSTHDNPNHYSVGSVRCKEVPVLRFYSGDIAKQL